MKKNSFIVFTAILITSFIVIRADGAVPADGCSSVTHSKPVIDRKTGELKGCRLTKVDAGSVYEALGLKVGDVVQSNTSSAMKIEAVRGAAKTVDRETVE